MSEDAQRTRALEVDTAPPPAHAALAEMAPGAQKPAQDEPPFLRASLIIFVISNAGSMLGFLFQWLLASQLEASAYGTVNTLLALSIYLAIPGQPLQLVYARHASRLLVAGDPAAAALVHGRMLRLVACAALVYAASLVASRGWIERSLRFDPLDLGLAVAIGIATLYFYLGLGVMQSLQRFAWLGIHQSGLQLFRLALGLALAVPWGVPGILVGTLAGPVFFGIWMEWDRRRMPLQLPARETTPAIPALLRDIWPLIVTFGGFVVLFKLDLIFVRYYFVAEDEAVAGRYAAAAILGNAILYLPLAVVNVTFAKVARAQARGEPHRHFLWKNLLLTLATSGVAAAILALTAEKALWVYGGLSDRYVAAAPILRGYVWPMVLFGLVQVFLNYFFALGHRSFAFLIVAANVAATALFIWRHENPEQIVASFTWVAGGLAVSCLILLPVFPSRDTRDGAFTPDR